jgi:ABC-2 type transport system ATP-binding protein
VLRGSEVLFHVGLEEERSRLISTFSVGMRQRTNLAQAIVHSPRLVILDEPTNGLDPAGRDEMLHLVRRLSTELGISVIMSSTCSRTSRACDACRHARAGGRDPADRNRGQNAPASLHVRVSGEIAAFRAAIARRGAAVGTLRTGAGGLKPERTCIRDAAAESSAGCGDARPGRRSGACWAMT